MAPPYGPLPMLLMSAIFESSCLAYLSIMRRRIHVSHEEEDACVMPRT